jgi:hypothetical protein
VEPAVFMPVHFDLLDSVADSSVGTIDAPETSMIARLRGKGGAASKRTDRPFTRVGPRGKNAFLERDFGA